MDDERHGEDPDVALRAARAFGDAGNYRAAAAVLHRLLAAHPEQAPAQSLLGLYLDYLGDPAGAISACRAAVATRPDDPDGHRLLGIVLSRRRAGWKGALEHLQEAVRLAPENGHNHYQLALQHARMLRPRYARRALAEACERGPADPIILAGAALMLFAYRRVRQAQALAARAFAAGPDSVMALTAEARSRLIGGRPGEALDLARAAVMLDATYDAAIEALVEADLCRWRLFAVWSRIRGWTAGGRLRGALLLYLGATGFAGVLVPAAEAAGPAGTIAVCAAGVLLGLWAVVPNLVLRRRIAAASRPARLRRRF